MNPAKFFDYMRDHFGGKMDADQVAGMEALLDAGKGLPLHHMANVLAQVRRETGGLMMPIKETVMAHHKNKHPTDKEVIARLDRAFTAGKLKWVKTPYWRDGWFGRGFIQITHKANYDRMGVTKESALLPSVAAQIAVRGMRDGLFTGRKLADYKFPNDLAAPPAQNPRRIVNGADGSDKEVAASHRQFAAALDAAGWGQVKETPKTEQVAPNVSKPSPWARLFSALLSLFNSPKR